MWRKVATMHGAKITHLSCSQLRKEMIKQWALRLADLAMNNRFGDGVPQAWAYHVDIRLYISTCKITRIIACYVVKKHAIKLIFGYTASELSLNTCVLKKTWPAGGKTAPGHCIKRRPSHAGQENPRTPAPSLHSGTVAHVRRPRPGPGLRPVLWPWDRRGDFFNLSLKFTPTGSRTQDLRSAAGFL